MVTDKLSFTHQFTEELSKHAGKAVFMPASEIGRALRYLEENGIPNNKQEDYKYCNIEAILRKEFKTILGEELALDNNYLKRTYNINDAYNIYVLNGCLVLNVSEIPAKTILTDIDKTPTELLKKYLTEKQLNDSLVAFFYILLLPLKSPLLFTT